jgi:hypothetical protein
MNIAFYNGMLLQVTLHDSKATILSKRKVGADTIDFYNYFAKYRPSPEKALLEFVKIFGANHAGFKFQDTGVHWEYLLFILFMQS